MAVMWCDMYDIKSKEMSRIEISEEFECFKEYKKCEKSDENNKDYPGIKDGEPCCGPLNNDQTKALKKELDEIGMPAGYDVLVTPKTIEVNHPTIGLNALLNNTIGAKNTAIGRDSLAIAKPSLKIIDNYNYKEGHPKSLEIYNHADKSMNKVYALGEKISEGGANYVVTYKEARHGEIVHYVQQIIDVENDALPQWLVNRFDANPESGIIEIPLSEWPIHEIGVSIPLKGISEPVDPNSEVLFTAFNNSSKNNFPW